MITHTASTTCIARGLIVGLALVLAASFSAVLPSGLLAAESSPMPETAASPEPTLAPAEAACESVEDLRLIIDFLRGTDASEDGWLPVLIGVIAALSETRQLANLVSETYRPMVDDLTGSLQDLGSTVDELRELETTGARLASIGEAITDIGNAMDALSVQLQTPCPTDG
jgi:hypothetical protein